MIIIITMSPEAFDSRAMAPPAKKSEKGYGDRNDRKQPPSHHVCLNVNRLWRHLRHSCIQSEDIKSRVSQLHPLKLSVQVAAKS